MLIKVTVHPESHEDRIVQTGTDTYEVYVRAGAQNGHANKMVTALLVRHFDTSVRMVSGGVRTHKIFRVG
jgi:uncharacterized protein (TIGR00251 family)